MESYAYALSNHQHHTNSGFEPALKSDLNQIGYRYL